MRYIKVFVSVLFVLAVAFFVARGCIHKRPISKPLTKKIGQPVKPAKPAKPAPSTGPRLAIILDDWGNNYPLLKYALEIKRPLTIAVLPHLAASRKLAEDAHRSGLGVMLHMPMQPYSGKVDLEPHTVLVTNTDAEITALLDSAFSSVPYAKGANNHMGSAVTSNARVMRTVLKHLKEKGYFFVDSNVIPKTQGPWIAKELGVRFTKRDIFIDNTPTPDAVKAQLRKAKRLALSKGRAVVIGHDKKVTLQTIREMVPEIEKEGVKFVLVEELLE